MVKLKNIKQSGTVVSADCYAEGKEEQHFHIIVDINEKRIIKNSLNERSVYATQAFYKIIRLLDSGRPLPSEASSTWC